MKTFVKLPESRTIPHFYYNFSILKNGWPIPNLICFYQLTFTKDFHGFLKTNNYFPTPALASSDCQLSSAQFSWSPLFLRLQQPAGFYPGKSSGVVQDPDHPKVRRLIQLSFGVGDHHAWPGWVQASGWADGWDLRWVGPEAWGERWGLGGEDLEDRVRLSFRATSWAKVTRSLFSVKVSSPPSKVPGSCWAEYFWVGQPERWGPGRS